MSARPLVVVFESGPSFDEQTWTAALDEGLPGWRGRVDARFVDNRRTRRSALADADVYVSTWVSSDVFRRAPHLSWVHLTLAGAGGDATVPPDVRLTTAAGVAAAGMAEHALMSMLALARRLPAALDNQRRWSWTQDGILEGVEGLAGRTAGIVGLGHAGRAIARLARAVGMNVAGASRSGAPVEDVAEIVPLHRLLEVADFLVLAASLNDSTRGLIGAAELKLLGPSSYLVNVARGELVDERALGDALRKGVIAGAAVDVLSKEPPPRRHPLRGAPNLIVTPHVAGNVHTHAREIRSRFVEQLGDVVRGGSGVV